MTEPWVVAAVFAATALLLAVTPNGEVTYLLQWFAAGSAVGMLVAYRARRRDTVVSVFRAVLFVALMLAVSVVGGFLYERVSEAILLAYGVVAITAVTALLPHYFWDGDPLFPLPRKRR